MLSIYERYKQSTNINVKWKSCSRRKDRIIFWIRIAQLWILHKNEVQFAIEIYNPMKNLILTYDFYSFQVNNTQMLSLAYTCEPSISIFVPFDKRSSTACSVSNVTKPKPRERLVAWSLIIWCSFTTPYSEKNSLNSSAINKTKQKRLLEKIRSDNQYKKRKKKHLHSSLLEFRQQKSSWSWNP